jgi:hypothetical protein
MTISCSQRFRNLIGNCFIVCSILIGQNYILAHGFCFVGVAAISNS